MKFIQDVLGHADIGTTLNIYADATRDLKKKEFDTFLSYLDEQQRGHPNNTP